MKTEENQDLRCGFVAIAGRPNVGKSTLMNNIIGMQLSIATARPQTTRNRILGIHTVEGRGQIVFVDTPGIHASTKRLNQRMVQAAWDALADADLVLFVTEQNTVRRSGRPALWGDDDRIMQRLVEMKRTVVLAVNKVDRLRKRTDLLPALQQLGGNEGIDAIIPISATSGENVDALLDVLFSKLPVAAPLFPADIITDRAERFLAAEYIRAQILEQTHEEVPYGVAVTIEEFIESPHEDVIEMQATIHVERESQKAIIIGKGGARIKEIGMAARHELQRFFGKGVRLRTLVRVETEWTEKDRSLHEFGYREDEI
jgi:GTP-binding protein Era